jgi:DHA2 family multidrug resistance protein
VRGFAVLLCIVPAVGLALSTPTPAELPYASGLFNVMRNLGGAVGIATVNTWLQDFTRLHTLRISEAMGHGGADSDRVVSALASQLENNGNADALLGAQAQVTAMVTRAAAVEAFRDVFMLLAGLFIVALVIVPFCKRPPLPAQASSPSAPPAAEPAAAH